MQYTIESRPLSSELTQQPASRRVFVEADDAEDAITQFVRQSEAELVSCTRPGQGQESIATVKKKDAVFLVRIYADV